MFIFKLLSNYQHRHHQWMVLERRRYTRDTHIYKYIIIKIKTREVTHKKMLRHGIIFVCSKGARQKHFYFKFVISQIRKVFKSHRMWVTFCVFLGTSTIIVNEIIIRNFRIWVNKMLITAIILILFSNYTFK